MCVDSSDVSVNSLITEDINIVTASTTSSDDVNEVVCVDSSDVSVNSLITEDINIVTASTTSSDDINGNAVQEYNTTNNITTITDTLEYTASAGRTYTLSLVNQNIISLSIPLMYYTRNVAHIGKNAFTKCFSLETITIPGSIISIGENAFNGCSSLSTILFTGNRPCIEINAFDETSKCIGYYYPNNSGWPGTVITGLSLISLLEITGTKSDGNTLTATQYLSTIGATDLSYQWYSNYFNSNSEGTAISGETSSTYSYTSSYAYVYVVVNYTVDGSSSSLTSNAF